MKKLINKVKYNQHKHKYQELDTPIKIVLFTEVAIGNLTDSGSQGGQI